jgi:hypothetical protein
MTWTGWSNACETAPLGRSVGKWWGGAGQKTTTFPRTMRATVQYRSDLRPCPAPSTSGASRAAGRVCWRHRIITGSMIARSLWTVLRLRMAPLSSCIAWSDLGLRGRRCWPQLALVLPPRLATCVERAGRSRWPMTTTTIAVWIAWSSATNNDHNIVLTCRPVDRRDGTIIRADEVPHGRRRVSGRRRVEHRAGRRRTAALLVGRARRVGTHCVVTEPVFRQSSSTIFSACHHGRQGSSNMLDWINNMTASSWMERVTGPGQSTNAGQSMHR